MSRAFVKETENDTIVRPDRPASPYRNFVTEAGLAAIEAALSRFETAHRAALESGDRNAAAAACEKSDIGAPAARARKWSKPLMTKARHPSA